MTASQRLPDLALQAARARAEIEQRMRQAIATPFTIRRVNACAVSILRDGDHTYLAAGLPNGERIDIPLAAHARATLLRELADKPDTPQT